MSPGNAAAPGRSTEGGAKNTGEAFTQEYSNHPVAGRLILPGKLADQLGDLAARIDRLTVRVDRLELLVAQLVRGRYFLRHRANTSGPIAACGHDCTGRPRISVDEAEPHHAMCIACYRTVVIELIEARQRIAELEAGKS